MRRGATSWASKSSAGRARIRSAVLMTSLFNTPRGQLQMTCALRSDQAVKAGFALRAIRDTIKPPK